MKERLKLVKRIKNIQRSQKAMAEFVDIDDEALNSMSLDDLKYYIEFINKFYFASSDKETDLIPKRTKSQKQVDDNRNNAARRDFFAATKSFKQKLPSVN